LDFEQEQLELLVFSSPRGFGIERAGAAVKAERSEPFFGQP
jgi:hypothetical protein